MKVPESRSTGCKFLCCEGPVCILIVRALSIPSHKVLYSYFRASSVAQPSSDGDYTGKSYGKSHIR